MSTQPPIEDINAVVNRFQAWAGAQKNGVRELTYDEAIRQVRRRERIAESSPKIEEPPAPVEPQSAKHRKAAKSGKSTKRVAANRRQPRVPRKADAIAAPEPLAFHQVLAEKVSILPGAASQELAIAERKKTTALSLRISLAEHVLLKKRAAEAGLSVSSYLRNCVFEVEELRARGDHPLAAKEALPLPNSRMATTDRLARFFMRMFGGRKSAFSLRA